ncbi:hypothetical protein GZH47_25540 [Paenibacillus rhizovicinus]|uniref:Lipoprotein n=1 Tax=Paenibacillus rhizovicinus TaxID=2704463 RepID=A0A6C0P5Q0_9BACL|nr:hypothetical protein [Paenibacillus rhizovicinus]QHW33827.1 hypothetical protein GZH47_25540 [Paenibacillus rhizovicinus]
MNQFLKGVLACCIVIVLTSCKQSSTNTQPDKLIQPDKVVVERLDPLHQSAVHFEKSVADKEVVETLYDKILSLPLFPQGPINCPNDNGVQYELTFTLESQKVSKAVVRATGCQGITMNDKTYWAMEPKGNGFIALLMHDIGLSDSR